MGNIDLNPLSGRFDIKGDPSGGGGLQPYISNVSPSVISINSQEVITISGYNFDARTIFDLGSNINIVNTTIIDPQHATLTVNTNSVVSTTNQVTATNGGQQQFNSPVYIETSLLTIIVPGVPGNPWQNIAGSITASQGRLEFSSGNQRDQSATFGTIPANTDGYLQYRIVNMTNAFFMAGLNDVNTSTSWNDLSFCIYVSSSPTIYESGVSRASVGGFVPGDVIKIERIGGVIRYYNGNTLLYTSSVINTNALFFDCSGYRNGIIDNIQLVF